VLRTGRCSLFEKSTLFQRGEKNPHFLKGKKKTKKFDKKLPIVQDKELRSVLKNTFSRSETLFQLNVATLILYNTIRFGLSAGAIPVRCEPSDAVKLP
jgi:hypothetical protein